MFIKIKTEMNGTPASHNSVLCPWVKFHAKRDSAAVSKHEMSENCSLTGFSVQTGSLLSHQMGEASLNVRALALISITRDIVLVSPLYFAKKFPPERENLQMNSPQQQNRFGNLCPAKSPHPE